MVFEHGAMAMAKFMHMSHFMHVSHYRHMLGTPVQKLWNQQIIHLKFVHVLQGRLHSIASEMCHVCIRFVETTSD